MLVEEERRRLAAIMFTDIVGYSALTQRSEGLALDVLVEHQRLLRPMFGQYSTAIPRRSPNACRRAVVWWSSSPATA